MPKIFVRGITLFQAKKIIQGSFSRFYRFNKEDFDASINTVRTVNISIVGEVTNPGSYTLSGANTALNALVAANGLKGIASPRNIQIIHANGEKKKLDVYQFLSTPSVTQDFFLFDNDFISVPVAERVVKIQGAVRRPHKYELINRENLKKLIEYAGGFADNAVQTNVQIKRYIDDKEKIIDVNYQNIQGTNTDFDVRNGDIVIVKTIPKTYENYVNVIGSVDLIGDYQIDNGMRVSDVLKKARLRPEARTDVAYLQRLNTDKTMSLKFLNLDDVLNNSASPYNLLLMPKDRLLIYPKSQFAQQDSLFVTGAVRTELRFPYDPQRTIRVSDLINLAGGLSADATDFAYIIRRDTKNYKFVEYKRIALQKAIDLPNSDENVVLQPNDQLKIQSRTTFVDEATVSVSGAVRQIGTYPWDKTLSLTDVLTLAGGLKLEAASNRIDVFRILLNGNEEVKTVVATVEVDKNLNVLNAADNFALQPYDQIVVRSIPEFNFQKTVTLSGELRYAGAYALIDKNEKITNLLLRAGGVTAEAFLPGATIYRQQDEIGYIVIKLDEAIKNPQSNYNIIMKDGDIVDIPKTKDIVTIKGATLATELYPEKILAGGKINVAYDGSHTVWYYVDKYAAGIGKDGRKRLISVEHPNGQIERTKDYLLFKSYPRVQKGSIITVGYVEKKKEYPKTETKRVDWSRVLADSVAQATALLTLIILVNRNL